MLQTLGQNISLNLHEAFSGVAELFRVDPQILRTHREGQAEIMAAKTKLRFVKKEYAEKKRELDLCQTRERELLVEKQKTEQELLLEQTKTEISQAREALAETRVAAHSRVSDLRRNLLLQQVQGQASEHHVAPPESAMVPA